MASGDQIDVLRPGALTPEAGLNYAAERFTNVGGILGRPLRKNDGYQFVTRVPSNGAPLATGLTFQVLTVDDPNNADPGKSYRLGITCKKLAGGTDTLAQAGAGTEAVADVVANATSGVVTATNIAVTTANADAPAAGDLVLVRIRRVGAAAQDTHGGVPVLVGVTVRDT